jgi:hypothetical protein
MAAAGHVPSIPARELACQPAGQFAAMVASCTVFKHIIESLFIP